MQKSITLIYVCFVENIHELSGGIIYNINHIVLYYNHETFRETYFF